jgi:hypothetical protein
MVRNTDSGKSNPSGTTARGVFAGVFCFYVAPGGAVVVFAGCHCCLP